LTQYSLLIEKSAEKLHKELLLKKNHKKFYENFAYSAKEVAEFITYKNSQKAVDKKV
jgi:hypothetical protein